MKKMLEFCRVLFAKTLAFREAPQGTHGVDPVYSFFVQASSAEKKRVYDSALRGAEADQKELMRRYEAMKKDLATV